MYFFQTVRIVVFFLIFYCATQLKVLGYYLFYWLYLCSL